MSKKKKNHGNSKNIAVNKIALPPIEHTIIRIKKDFDQSSLPMPPLWLKIADAAPSHDNDLLHQALGIINGAHNKIILSSFLLADSDVEDALKNAAERGVHVYALIASENKIEIIPKDDDQFSQKTRDQLIGIMNRLAGGVLFRSVEYVHAKCVVADWDSKDHCQGILLTANLGKEALTRNEELGVPLTPNEISELMPYLKWCFWEEAKHEFLQKDFQAINSLNLIPHPNTVSSSNIFATTSKTNCLRDHVRHLIQGAKKTLVVACYGWQQDHDVVKDLIKKAEEGVQVTILARIRGAAMPSLIDLARAGADVYGFKYLHAKAIVADGTECLVMSANFEKDGMDNGFEVGISLSKKTDDPRFNSVVTKLNDWKLKSQWKLFVEKHRKDFTDDKEFIPFIKDERKDELKADFKSGAGDEIKTAYTTLSMDEYNSSERIKINSLHELEERMNQCKDTIQKNIKLPVARNLKVSLVMELPVLPLGALAVMDSSGKPFDPPIFCLTNPDRNAVQNKVQSGGFAEQTHSSKDLYGKPHLKGTEQAPVGNPNPPEFHGISIDNCPLGSLVVALKQKDINNPERMGQAKALFDSYQAKAIVLECLEDSEDILWLC